jgi:hypothetical protein
VEVIETLTTGPNLFASIVMGVVLIYWLMVIAGAADIELFDFDIDIGADVDIDGDIDVGSATSVGFVVLRFLNIGQVPLVIWGSVFVIGFWISSLAFTLFFDDRTTYSDYTTVALYVLRNFAIGVFGAKLITTPMVPWFEIDEGPKPEELVGKSCEVTAPLKADSRGQASFRTNAAPLLIHVRCEKDEFRKGDTARIVAYDAETKTYLIESVREV